MKGAPLVALANNVYHRVLKRADFTANPKKIHTKKKNIKYEKKNQ